MTRMTNRDMAVGAMVAALYFALGIAFAPISFGPVQVRVAEALTMLCIFSPAAVYGVTIGCVITNVYGLAMGFNILGPIDIVAGSLATLAAGYLTYKMGHIRAFDLPMLAVLPPVLLNVVVIGGEIVFAVTGGFSPLLWLAFGAEVGVGQLVSCGVLGLMLVRTLEKTGLAGRIFLDTQQL